MRRLILAIGSFFVPAAGFALIYEDVVSAVLSDHERLLIITAGNIESVASKPQYPE